jgi:hypothetical protein
MLLLTWHGTLVCLRQNGGGLVHLPPGTQAADTVPLDLDIAQAPPAARHTVQSIIGPLAVEAVGGSRAISLARYGQYLCAPPERSELAFDRSEANIWESFLPITQQTLDDLAALAGSTWIVRDTRQIVRGGAIRLQDGFTLDVAGTMLDLQSGVPERLGPDSAPATGFRIDFGDRLLELVRAEPRSSLLIDTKPWPTRARRIAELMVLAAHRQIAGHEPEQDVFEQDVAFLLAGNVAARLDPLLQRLMDMEAAKQPVSANPTSPVTVDQPPAPGFEDVVLGWALSQTAPWAPGSLNPAGSRAAFDVLNKTTDQAFIFHVRNGLVSLEAKPENRRPSPLQSGRASLYLQFLQDAAAQLPGDLATTFCLCVEGTPPDTGDIPVFHFHKSVGERTLLLPDIELIGHEFFEGEDAEDPFSYFGKQASAGFAGATSGGAITPDVARDLSLPRLRAAAFFDSHEAVDFRLPDIVQCEAGAEEILRAKPFCQKPMPPWEEQLQYRLLIDMDGNGPDCARTAAILHSNSVLLKYASPDSLFYAAGLQPWIHYIPVSHDEDVESVLAREANNPDLFERIAQNGRVFAQTYLTRAGAESYTARLIEQYALLLAPPGAQLDTAADTVPGISPARRTMVLVHVQGRGDVQQPAGAWAGEPGSGAAIEGFGIAFAPDVPRAGLSYQAVLTGGALSAAAMDGEYLGTRGEAMPLYGLCISVDEYAAANVEITYEAHFTDGSKTGPCLAGQVCTSESGAPLEAFLVQVKGLKSAAGTQDPIQGVIQASADFNEARPMVGPDGTLPPGLMDAANDALATFCRTAGLFESFRFAFHHRPANGPDVEVAVITLDSFDLGTIVHINPAHDDPWTFLLRATALLYVVEAMLAYAPMEPCQILAELGDVGFRDDSVSFCSASPQAFLLPDPDFIGSGGYESTRQLISELNITWQDRRPVAFWRGSTTGGMRHDIPADGQADDFTWLPRLDMCFRARTSPHAALYDVGVSALINPDDHAMRARLEAADLLRPPAGRDTFVSCKAILVIDGNSNAWSALFCALLSGACVLRVDSERGFRQWYYDDLKPWVNYVPVRSDLSDMDDAVAWVMANDDAARRIGEAGRALADAMTFESVVAESARRLRAWVER